MKFSLFFRILGCSVIAAQGFCFCAKALPPLDASNKNIAKSPKNLTECKTFDEKLAFFIKKAKSYRPKCLLASDARPGAKPANIERDNEGNPLYFLPQSRSFQPKTPHFVHSDITDINPSFDPQAPREDGFEFWASNEKVRRHFQRFFSLASERRQEWAHHKAIDTWFMALAPNPFIPDPQGQINLAKTMGRSPINIAMTVFWNLYQDSWIKMVRHMARITQSPTLLADLERMAQGLSFSANALMTSWQEEDFSDPDIIHRYKAIATLFTFVSTWPSIELGAHNAYDVLSAYGHHTSLSLTSLHRYLEHFWRQNAYVWRGIQDGVWHLEREYVPYCALKAGPKDPDPQPAPEPDDPCEAIGICVKKPAA